MAGGSNHEFPFNAGIGKSAPVRMPLPFSTDLIIPAPGARMPLRLYKRHRVDHEGLFRLAKKIKRDFLMTYDKPRKFAHWPQRTGLKHASVAIWPGLSRETQNLTLLTLSNQVNTSFLLIFSLLTLQKGVQYRRK